MSNMSIQTLISLSPCTFEIFQQIYATLIIMPCVQYNVYTCDKINVCACAFNLTILTVDPSSCVQDLLKYII